MRKTIGTKSDTGQFVACERNKKRPSLHADIELPAEGLVAMVDRLMLRIQASLQPRVSWEREDACSRHITTLRWATTTSQLQLAAHLSSWGVSIWLHPRFGSMIQLGDTHDFAYWTAKRSTFRVARENDYGRLYVVGVEDAASDPPDHKYVELKFDDPVFEGIAYSEAPNHTGKPKPERGDLGEHIIALTQKHINAMLAAG